MHRSSFGRMDGGRIEYHLSRNTLHSSLFRSSKINLFSVWIAYQMKVGSGISNGDANFLTVSWIWRWGFWKIYKVSAFIRKDEISGFGRRMSRVYTRLGTGKGCSWQIELMKIRMVLLQSCGRSRSLVKLPSLCGDSSGTDYPLKPICARGMWKYMILHAHFAKIKKRMQHTSFLVAAKSCHFGGNHYRGPIPQPRFQRTPVCTSSNKCFEMEMTLAIKNGSAGGLPWHGVSGSIGIRLFLKRKGLMTVRSWRMPYSSARPG